MLEYEFYRKSEGWRYQRERERERIRQKEERKSDQFSFQNTFFHHFKCECLNSNPEFPKRRKRRRRKRRRRKRRRRKRRRRKRRRRKRRRRKRRRRRSNKRKREGRSEKNCKMNRYRWLEIKALRREKSCKCIQILIHNFSLHENKYQRERERERGEREKKRKRGREKERGVRQSKGKETILWGKRMSSYLVYSHSFWFLHPSISFFFLFHFSCEETWKWRSARKNKKTILRHWEGKRTRQWERERERERMKGKSSRSKGRKKRCARNRSVTTNIVSCMFGLVQKGGRKWKEWRRNGNKKQKIRERKKSKKEGKYKEM